MPLDPEPKPGADAPPTGSWPRVCEWAGLAVLALLAAYFLRVSWRKWPDPIIDSGPQWYATWRVSLGAAPFHDFAWNYGPFSLACDGLLFKIFGPGMMMLVAANLVVYAAIVTLAYLVFRLAWGRLAAFCACAVFIAVFSFSILNGVGNYNYATPYSQEVTHGMLLLLAGVFVAARWSGQGSRASAFLLGLCGGLAAVLKPEFMLALGILGIAAWLLRFAQRQSPEPAEWALIGAGVALPTLVFTIWLARWESWPAALRDASNAWWPLLAHPRDSGVLYQVGFLGVNNPWLNALGEARAALAAAVIFGAIWAAGWALNRAWGSLLKIPMAAAALVVAASIHLSNGWLGAGRCLPGLMLIAVGLTAWQAAGEWRRTGRLSNRRRMALLLVLAAGAMLARMPLRARLDHFGFFQAALAGMVTAAMAVAEVPRWTGVGAAGRRLAALGCAALLAAGCCAVAAQSARIHADQTQPVGAGSDLFYAFDPLTDETGRQVNWCVEHLRNIPPEATLQVIPEGSMINYLTRHQRPLQDLFGDDEIGYVAQLERARPDYVVFITRDLREYGIQHFGAPGNLGEKILQWLRENYTAVDAMTRGSRGATILRRKQ